MKQRILTIIASCLVLTGCMGDTGISGIPSEALKSVTGFTAEDIGNAAKRVKYKTAGDCGNLCELDWWKTATASDLKAELIAGAAVMGRVDVDNDHRDGGGLFDWGAKKSYWGGGTPLHFAATEGTPAHIKILINAGAKINAKDVNGQRPLHRAAIEGTPANIKALLSAGADHDARNKESDTPLHVAAVYGNPAIIQALLTAGGLYTRNKDGDTPLNAEKWDAEGGHIVPAKNMKTLVLAGADVNTMNNCSRTPLTKATRVGGPAEIMFLLKAGANPQPKKNSWSCWAANPLEAAAKNKKLKGTKAFYALRDATYK
ncbi:ankyrin repeat domain-containing protein [Paracoccaceae bacterium]|nr:ankyrin repeat domain-containing protein [Paracoccaceae bacterium]